MQSALLDRSDAARHLALGVSTFERLVRLGEAPKPRLISGRRVGWLRTELDAYAAALPVSDLLPPKNTGKRE